MNRARPSTAPERGCVADQPQQTETDGQWNSAAFPVFFRVLRLVEDDTAALRQIDRKYGENKRAMASRNFAG